MNIKEKKTYQTARNKAQIRRKQEGGEGYTRPPLDGANTPSRKKIKKFQKIKNSNVITYKITHCQN